MTIEQRIKSPTPKFFKKIRNAGVVLASISATILAAPVALPAVVVQAVSFLAVAGSVASAVSQTAVGGRTHKNQKNGKFTKRR